MSFKKVIIERSPTGNANTMSKSSLMLVPCCDLNTLNSLFHDMIVISYSHMTHYICLFVKKAFLRKSGNKIDIHTLKVEGVV